jgi:hypothetical protein
MIDDELRQPIAAEIEIEPDLAALSPEELAAEQRSYAERAERVRQRGRNGGLQPREVKRGKAD